MEYVRVTPIDKGFYLDPEDYLAALPGIQSRLPDGARAFALDEDHYDFFGPRCVKDLKLRQIDCVDENDQLSLCLRFSPNTFKHDAGLVVRYKDVARFFIDVTAAPRAGKVWPATARLGDVQLDEVLPHEKGCSHEISMTGGIVTVLAADLCAEWASMERGGS